MKHRYLNDQLYTSICVAIYSDDDPVLPRVQLRAFSALTCLLFILSIRLSP